MMKKLSLLILILTVGCNQKKNNPELLSKNFNLSGTISGDYSDYIFLGYGKNKDSAKVTNGKFEFSGQLDLPTQQGWLNLRPTANSQWIFLESSNIKLTTEYTQTINQGEKFNVLEIKDIKGSKTAIIEEKYRAFWKENKLKSNLNILLYKELTSMFKENPKHSICGQILGRLASSNSVLTINELENLYSIIDTSYQNKIDLGYYKTGMSSLKKYNVGKDFVSFKLPNQNSKIIDIDNYKGKFTLVDFWASWCGPCRKKHPKLLELYSKFDHEKFDIISVSVDENEEKWKKAIEKDNLIWENVIDKESKTFDKLGLQQIPHNYLLDIDGKIIGVNLSIENIQKLIFDKTSG